LVAPFCFFWSFSTFDFAKLYQILGGYANSAAYRFVDCAGDNALVPFLY